MYFRNHIPAGERINTGQEREDFHSLYKSSGWFLFTMKVLDGSHACIIFQWIFNNQYGLLNSVLSQVFGLDSWTHNWLGEGKWAMFSIVVVSLWKNMGMLVILFMAGLAGIPHDIIESAKIDGANGIQTIFRIILPNLKESYVICGLWAIIQSVKVFEQPFVMTNGGLERLLWYCISIPGRTHSNIMKWVMHLQLLISSVLLFWHFLLSTCL